jgi:hypothetical protein
MSLMFFYNTLRSLQQHSLSRRSYLRFEISGSQSGGALTHFTPVAVMSTLSTGYLDHPLESSL